jgi:hypothetical protein
MGGVVASTATAGSTVVVGDAGGAAGREPPHALDHTTIQQLAASLHAIA